MRQTLKRLIFSIGFAGLIGLAGCSNMMGETPRGILPPEIPSDVTATSPANGQIAVVWDGEAYGGSYLIAVDTVTPYDGTSIAQVSSTNVAASLTGLINDDYYVYVIPVNRDGTHGDPVIANGGVALTVLNPGTALPDDPSNILAVASDYGEVEVTWTGDPADGSYRIVIDDSDPMDDPLSVSQSNSSSPATLISVPGGDFYVYVIPVEPDGTEGDPFLANSGATITVDAGIPEDPYNVTASSSEAAKISVSWDGDAKEGSYRIIIDETSPAVEPYSKSITSATSPEEVTSVAYGDYYVYVVPVNADATEGDAVAANSGASIYVEGIEPDAPSNVSASSPESGKINVSWTGGTNDGSYKVVVDSESPASEPYEKVQENASSPLELTGISDGEYYVYVIPVDEEGNEGTAVAADEELITVLPPANSVVAVNDTWTMYEGKTTIIPVVNLLANDSNNLNSDPLEIVEVKNASEGTIDSFDGTNITFTSTGSSGTNATFEYVARIQDDDRVTSTATVTITIDPAPSVVANADSYSLQQGGETYITTSELMDNDEGSGLEFLSVSNAVGGTVSLNGSNITFTSTGYAYEPASFDYTIKDNLHTEATGTVYVSISPLAPVNAYIYSDQTAFNAKIFAYHPPTVEGVFDTWGRFDGNNFYDNKAEAIAAGGNADDWVLLEDDYDGDGDIDKRVSMPTNVDPYNGFVCPESDKLDSFTFEATITSDNGDDDTIGLVIAFVRVGSVNYTLSVVRSQDGAVPETGWGVTYGTGTSSVDYNNGDIEWIIEEKAFGSALQSAWNGQKTRIKIIRDGDLVTLYATDWDDTENYDASSKIEIDLTSDARLEKFRGAQKYGYSTFSQPYSTYLDIAFDGGIDYYTIIKVDPATGDSEVWKYNDTTSSWYKENSLTVQDELGFVRQVSNPETGKTFLLKQNSIELVE